MICPQTVKFFRLDYGELFFMSAGRYCFFKKNKIRNKFTSTFRGEGRVKCVRLN